MSGDTSGNLLGLSVAVNLLEFAHTSAFVVCRVCVQLMRKISSRSVSSVVGGARATATRELQHDTSLRKFFVLGALVPAMLLATWWVRPPSMTGGVGNPTTVAKEHFHLFSPPMHFNPSQAMFSNGLATICAARFEQLCGSRATFYFCVSTLTICESMSRPRGVVTPEELSCVLKPFVTSRSWLVYDEAAKVSESKLHKGNALKHVALLTALHEHSPSLVFTRSVVTTAFKQLVVQFGMSQDASKDWVETMTNRLQNLCKTVSQSLRKNPSSEFASTFPWSPTATDTAADKTALAPVTFASAVTIWTLFPSTHVRTHSQIFVSAKGSQTKLRFVST